MKTAPSTRQVMADVLQDLLDATETTATLEAGGAQLRRARARALVLFAMLQAVGPQEGAPTR